MTPHTTDHLLEVYFEDLTLVPDLYGEHNRYIEMLEKGLNVSIQARSHKIKIIGHKDETMRAQEAVSALWERLQEGLTITDAEVAAAIRIAEANVDSDTKHKAMKAFSSRPQKIRTKRKHISPRSATQAAYLEAIDSHDIVFGIGPAGTGKTYLAVAQGVSKLLDGKVERLVITRPAVEAGERLGFLPGDMQEKLDPYLRPVYDALYDMLPQDQVVQMMAQGQIEIAPLAFMRGRTLSNAFIVLDEAQNTTSMQMKMVLTRLGENSRMVLNGDGSQTDLPNGMKSGLAVAVDLLRGVKGISITEFKVEDVVRHPLVGEIIKRYEASESK